MTYATITTTKEVLEMVETSRQDQSQQPHIFHSLFQRLGKFDSTR
jgi:hypothetical protein